MFSILLRNLPQLRFLDICKFDPGTPDLASSVRHPPVSVRSIQMIRCSKERFGKRWRGKTVGEGQNGKFEEYKVRPLVFICFMIVV